MTSLRFSWYPDTRPPWNDGSACSRKCDRSRRESGLIFLKSSSRGGFFMRKPAAILALIGAIMVVAIPAIATDIGAIINNKPERDNFQLIHVDDLAKLMADPNAHVHLF